MVDQLCETIILSEAKENWQKILEKCLLDFNNINTLEISNKVIQISNEHSLTHYPSAILWHSSY